MEPPQNLSVNRTTDGRWIKGQSANPATQFQKGNTAAAHSNRHALLSRAYRDQLEMVCETDSQRRTFAQVIAESLALRAVKGDVAAAAELCDRVEGRPRQSIALSREEEQADVYGIIQRLTGHGTRELTAGTADDGSAASGSDAVEQ